MDDGPVLRQLDEEIAALKEALSLEHTKLKSIADKISALNQQLADRKANAEPTTLEDGECSLTLLAPPPLFRNVLPAY